MEAFPTGRFPSSWKLSPQLAQSDEVATAFGGEKWWTITRRQNRPERTGRRGEERRRSGESLWSQGAFSSKKRKYVKRIFLQCWKRKNGNFMKRKPHGYFFTDIWENKRFMPERVWKIMRIRARQLLENERKIQTLIKPPASTFTGGLNLIHIQWNVPLFPNILCV